MTVSMAIGCENTVVYKMANVFCSDDKLMARDFTYIDDVTRGVVAAMKYEATQCGQVFNIGRGSPVAVRRMIDILETELNVTAKIVSYIIFETRATFT